MNIVFRHYVRFGNHIFSLFSFIFSVHVNEKWKTVSTCKMNTHFFYRQLDFSSEPGVANEILENELSFIVDF